MAFWRNNSMMPLLAGQRLVDITHTESAHMRRHADLQRTRVVMAPKNRKSCSIKMSVSNDEVNINVKCEDMRNPQNVVTVILGGGAGTRLFPLTQTRAKPAVPIGGAYRLIDVAMSNCFYSGLNKVYVLTQFNSTSLNRHVTHTYKIRNNVAFGDGFVEVLAATQTPGVNGMNWFQGTADAVRQFAWLFEDTKSNEIEDVLIFSGDHLYRMDYMDFIQSHRQSGADVTISCLPMDGSRASDFGLINIDDTGRIISFSEKPKGDDLKAMEVDTSVLGLSREEALNKPYIASMGIYVFRKDVLLKLLRRRFPSANDFGSEIKSASTKEFLVKAFLFNDYWEDIGTIRSFFEANLALTDDQPRFNFYDEDKPMYKSRRNLPPSMINSSKVTDSIISHGCILDNCSIVHSVIGVQSRISANVRMKDTVMFGADLYETDDERASLVREGKVPVGIGENSVISNCIIDKNARIGRNVKITNSEGIQEANRKSDGFYIRDGLIIIPKRSTIVDGIII
ncbi:glucose-1-phosphate adenylyltransferase large subunit 1, chloroplastic/amyloplastic-like [Carex rostrata]